MTWKRNLLLNLVTILFSGHDIEISQSLWDSNFSTLLILINVSSVVSFILNATGCNPTKCNIAGNDSLKVVKTWKLKKIVYHEHEHRVLKLQQSEKISWKTTLKIKGQNYLTFPKNNITWLHVSTTFKTESTKSNAVARL